MEELEEILRQIEGEAARATRALRVVPSVLPGEAVRQGDVYLFALAAPPADAGPEVATRRLAPGGDAGSRHVVEGDGEIRLRPAGTGAGRDPCAGPYLHARERLVVAHPEHAHLSIPAGWYEVRYQVDYSAPGPAVRPWERATGPAGHVAPASRRAAD